MPRTMSAIQSAQLPKLSTINAELVLGVASRASFTVRAEGVCAVTEIEARSFLTTLQRFPQEVTRLLRKVSGSGFGQHNKGGALWPTKVEMVPFLSNLGPSFFNRLMEVSEWTMFGPGHRVVRQGGAGNILFLLCHGSAVSKIDGVVVGNPLGPGDVVGDANFLGVTTKYAATVKTTTVCHFRTLTTTLLNKLLPEQPTERKSFEHLRHEVRKQIVIQAQANKQEVLQEKLRRRVDLAFHQHVQQTRSARTERLAHGKAAAARGKSRESEATSQAEDDASQRKRVSSLKAGGGDLAAQLQALAGGKNIDDETDSFGSGSASETEVDNLAALTTSPRKDGVAFRRRVSIDAPTVYTNWRRRSSAFSGVPAGVTPTNHTNNNYNNNNNNDDSSSFSSSNNNNRNSNDELEETAPPKLKLGPVTAAHAKVAIQRRRKWLLNKNSNNNSKRGEEQGDVSRQPFVERVKEAINDYRDRRQEASMKGRVMRLMRNGYPLGPLDAGEPGQPSGVDEDEEARDDFFPDDAPELKSQADTTGTNMSQSQVSSMFDLSELSPEEILHLIQAPGKVRLPDQLSYKEVQRLQKVLPSLPDDKVVSHKSVLPRLSDDPSPELPSLELRQALRSKFRSLTHFRRVPVQQSF
ncbi:unnamed protein product [Polarella glacialis]|uniref:Cyclic nucleotide-binding domain-containing protein n=1 Tax=Polarella glacialis TaxID=89957 RepID=A0A813GD68_POLGL|nr:unnamed protein product [Polarella glacialis]